MVKRPDVQTAKQSNSRKMPILPEQTKLTWGRIDKAGDAYLVTYVILAYIYKVSANVDDTRISCKASFLIAARKAPRFW